MTDSSGLDNLFDEDKNLSSKENENQLSGFLDLAGNIILGFGAIGFVASMFVSAVIESGFPIFIGTASLLGSWISSLVLKGIAKIIDLLVDIKNK